MSAVLWVCLALLVLLRALLTFVPSMWGWGLNVQRFLDPLSSWGLWLLSALTLIPAIARGLARPLERIGDVAGDRRMALGAWVGGALLVWLMPDRVWFVGDFLLPQGYVQAGGFAASFLNAMPLESLLHGALLHGLGIGSIAVASLASRMLGAIEAGTLAVLCLQYARAIGVAGAPAALAAAVAFFGGHLTLFTGLGKASSESCLVIVALAVFGIEAIRKRTSLLRFGTVMALAFWLHRSSVFLIPTWIAVVWLWSRGNPDAWKNPGGWVTLLAPGLVAALALPRILGLAMGYDLAHHVLTAETTRDGGLLGAAFAPRHLLDLINLAATWSPLALALLALLAIRARDRVDRPGGFVRAGPAVRSTAARHLPRLGCLRARGHRLRPAPGLRGRGTAARRPDSRLARDLGDRGGHGVRAAVAGPQPRRGARGLAGARLPARAAGRRGRGSGAGVGLPRLAQHASPSLERRGRCRGARGPIRAAPQGALDVGAVGDHERQPRCGRARVPADARSRLRGSARLDRNGGRGPAHRQSDSARQRTGEAALVPASGSRDAHDSPSPELLPAGVAGLDRLMVAVERVGDASLTNWCGFGRLGTAPPAARR